MEEFSVAKLFEVEFQMMKSLEELKNILYQSLKGDYYSLIAIMLDPNEIKFGGQKHFNNYMLRGEKVRALSQKCQFFVSDFDIRTFFSRAAKENTEYIFANLLINSIVPYKTEFACFKSLSKENSKDSGNDTTDKKEDKVIGVSELSGSKKSSYNPEYTSPPPKKNPEIYSNPKSTEVKSVAERDKNFQKDAYYSSFGLRGTLTSSQMSSQRQDFPIENNPKPNEPLKNSKGLISNKEEFNEKMNLRESHQSKGLKEEVIEIAENNLQIEISSQIENLDDIFQPDNISMVSDILPDSNEEILLFLLENISEILKEREIVKAEFLKNTGISLETLFGIFDNSRKKAISIGDFKKILKSLDLEYQDEILRLLFLRFDVDFDGYLNYNEFKRLIRPVRNLIGSVSPMSYELSRNEDPSKYANSEFKRKISRLLLFLLRTEEAWEFLKKQLQKTENFNYFNAFETIDVNQDNFITCEDLKEFSNSRKVKIEAEELFDLLDKSLNSKLSYDQFYKELTPFK